MMLLRTLRQAGCLGLVGLGLCLAVGLSSDAWADTVNAPITSWTWPSESMVYDASTGRLTLAFSQEPTRQTDLLPDTLSDAALVASPGGQTVWRLMNMTGRVVSSASATADFGGAGCRGGYWQRAVVAMDGRIWIPCDSRVMFGTVDGQVQQVSLPDLGYAPFFGFVYTQNQFLYGLTRGPVPGCSDVKALCLTTIDTSNNGFALSKWNEAYLPNTFGDSTISGYDVSRAYFLSPGSGFVQVYLNGPNRHAWLRYASSNPAPWAPWNPDFNPVSEVPRSIFLVGAYPWVVTDTAIHIMDPGGVSSLKTLALPTGVSVQTAGLARNNVVWVAASSGELLLYSASDGQERLLGRSNVLSVGNQVSSITPAPGDDAAVLVAPATCASGSGRCVANMTAASRYASKGVAAISPVYTGPTIYKVLSRLSPVAYQAAGTDVRWALSFDRGVTWRVYQNGGWQQLPSMTAVETAGMSTQTLSELTRTSLGQFADRPFQAAVALLASPDQSAAPQLASLSAEFGLYEAPTAGGLSCPPQTRFGVAVDCAVSATAPLGTLKYNWTATPSTTLVSGSGQAATITPRRVEAVLVTVSVSLVEDPSQTSAPLTTTIEVTPPELRISIFCPADRVGRRQDLICDADMNGTAGTPQIRWDTGDGVGQTENGGLRLKARWTTLGQKTVSAVASLLEAPGYEATSSVTVEVFGWQKPSMRMTGPLQIVRGSVAAFQGVAALPRGAAPGKLEIQWDVFGQISSGQVLNLKGERVGKLLVKAKAVIVEANGDPDAESDTVQQELTVSPMPKPKLSMRGPRFAVEGFPVTLQAQVKHTGPVTLEWMLPDGSVVSGQPSLTYTPDSSGGVHVVKVRAIPEGSVTEDEIASVTVNYPILSYSFPVFALEKRGDKDPSVPYTVAYKLNGNVRNAPGAIFTYAWDFGDGETATGKKAGMTHVYRAPGTYHVSVTVSDQAGHSQTVTDQLVVEDSKPMKIGLSTMSSNRWFKAPLTVKVRPTITGLKDDKIMKYEWLLNDSIVSLNNVGVAVFREPGDYLLTLRVTSRKGQTGEAQLNVSVVANQPPTCSVSQQPSTFRPKQVRLTAACLDQDGRVKGYRWDLGDGRAIENRAIVVVEYQEPGSYQVVMTATDDDGATAEVTESVIIN
ncbi:MAG: PKD domain-containing protein [Nitrospirota bacterium]